VWWGEEEEEEEEGGGAEEAPSDTPIATPPCSARWADMARRVGVINRLDELNTECMLAGDWKECATAGDAVVDAVPRAGVRGTETTPLSPLSARAPLSPSDWAAEPPSSSAPCWNARRGRQRRGRSPTPAEG